MLTRTKEVFPSIGKLLNDAIAWEISAPFIEISIGDALITLTDDVINDLSTDQFCCYKIVSDSHEPVLTCDMTTEEVKQIIFQLMSVPNRSVN